MSAIAALDKSREPSVQPAHGGKPPSRETLLDHHAHAQEVTAVTAIVARTELGGGRPDATYRTAGDRQVLIEYGQPYPVDLGANFFVHAAASRLEAQPVRGITEVTPGLRSMLVGFDPSVIAQGKVIAALDELHGDLPEPASITLPSRRVRLPIAFDDSASRDAVDRYRISQRPDAPNVVDGNNIDYIVRCNGLADRETLYSSVLGCEWWNAFSGFYPGLPSLLPLDPRSELSAPKYNPARNWTPEGTVAIGGPCLVIYPIESSGSYQLFGRTLPISYLAPRRPQTLRIDPIVIQPGDRISFYVISEPELIELRRQVFEGRYDYEIEPGRFAAADYFRAAAEPVVAAEAARRQSSRAAAQELVRIP